MSAIGIATAHARGIKEAQKLVGKYQMTRSQALRLSVSAATDVYPTNDELFEAYLSGFEEYLNGMVSE